MMKPINATPAKEAARPTPMEIFWACDMLDLELAGEEFGVDVEEDVLWELEPVKGVVDTWAALLGEV